MIEKFERVRLKHGAYHYDLGRDENGKRRSKRLCGEDEGEYGILKALAELAKPKSTTIKDLLLVFLGKGMLELSPRTQKDYWRYAHTRLIPVFGDLDPADLETSDVAQYLEGRKERARVSANKEIACLSSAYEYGLRMGLVKSNPCRGVRRNKVRPRTRYVTDDEFLKVFNAAPEWFQDYMSSVYLMGLRPHEARDLLRTSITPKGIVFQESKTKKVRQIGWSDALQFFVVRATSRFPTSPYIFTNSRGQKLTEWAVHSMMHRIREQVGGEAFRIHDLRAKGESDHERGMGLLALYKRRHVTTPVR